MTETTTYPQRRRSIGKIHYVRLGVRLALLIAAPLVAWKPWMAVAVWVLFAVEMVARFFPSKIEGPGSQKHLAVNFIPRKPAPDPEDDLHAAIMHRRAGRVAVVWLAFNLTFGILNIAGKLSDNFMVLLFLFYAVCDEVCILFFCPFQRFFIHNSCCTTCRMYNWNFIMMCTPLLFIPGWWSWSLFALSLAVFVHWEIAAHKHPERFSRRSNAALQCRGCTDSTCILKRQNRP